MRLQYVKAKRIEIIDPLDGVDEKEDPGLAFDFSHHLTQYEDRYVCTTEIKVSSTTKNNSESRVFMDTVFESMLLKEEKDEQEEKAIYQESFNQVYFHIRILLVSLMASAMLRPFLLPVNPPDLEKNVGLKTD